MWLDEAERDGSYGVRENLRLLPKNAHQAILDSLEGTPHVPGARVRQGGLQPSSRRGIHRIDFDSAGALTPASGAACVKGGSRWHVTV